MPVERHGDEPVDGLATAFLADPLWRGVEIEMTE
jgi:hypothetical protein